MQSPNDVTQKIEKTLTNHLSHNILTNQQWFLQQQEMPTGVACLAADFVGKGGCEGAVCFHPILFVAFPLARTPQLPFTIKPGGLTCYTTTGVSCLQCGQCGHAWMKFPAHNKKATDT